MKKHPTDLLLVGTGPMAVEYARVLLAQRQPFTAVGLTLESATKFNETTGVQAEIGGANAWVSRNTAPRRAIVVVSENLLGKVTLDLLRQGVKNILVEKPGGFAIPEIRKVETEAKKRRAKIYVGYNRRFYASVLAAEPLIRKDGGVTSFHFEFTEWGHVISKLHKGPGVKAGWLLHNSTHVIDLAFFLGGYPKQWSTYKHGQLPWHPSGARYAGAGLTKHNAVFSYQANWQAPGRWGVEMLTRKRRFIFRPMEKLQVQLLGSVQITELPLKSTLDVDYKPGLFLQTQAFLKPSRLSRRLCTISEQVSHLPLYTKLAYR